MFSKCSDDACPQASLDMLRARIARLERRPPAHAARMLHFGVPAIDGHLPGGGLLAGALHEVAGEGTDIEHGAAASLFLAGLLARRRGPVLWARDAGRPVRPRPARRRAASGPGGVRRSRRGRAAGDGGRRCATPAWPAWWARWARWGSPPPAACSSPPKPPASPPSPCAASARPPTRLWPNLMPPSRGGAWPPGPRPRRLPTRRTCRAWPARAGRLDLVRCRGGAPATWTVEACDAQGRLTLATDLSHRQAPPRHSHRLTARSSPACMMAAAS